MHIPCIFFPISLTKMSQGGVRRHQRRLSQSVFDFPDDVLQPPPVADNDSFDKVGFTFTSACALTQLDSDLVFILLNTYASLFTIFVFHFRNAKRSGHL